MKRNKKLTLSKRILAMMLTVAMVATGIPSTTALAAELPAADQTVVEETAEEELNVVPVDGAQENTEETPAATEEASEVADETPDAAVEAPEAADTTEASEEAPEAEDTTVIENAAVSTASKIVINRTSINGYDSVKDTVKSTFDPYNEDQMQLLLGQVKAATNVEMDGADDDLKATMKEKLTYTWQKQQQDGTYADMTLEPGKAPYGAGEYQLQIKLAKEEGLWDEASTGVKISVAKQSLELKNYPYEVKVGDTVGDLLAKLTDEENSTVKLYATKTGTYVTLKDFTDLSKLTIAVKVTYAEKEEDLKDNLAADTVFEKGKSYGYTISVPLKEDKAENYEIKDLGLIDLRFAGEITTEMVVTYLKPEFPSYNYTGEAIAMPKEGEDYSVEVTYTDEKGKKVKIENAEIKAQWLGADEQELPEGEAPVNAGKYFYKLSYSDATGRYKDCDNTNNLIPVEIKPISLHLVPTLKDNIVITDGMTADMLYNEIGYEVFKVDATGKEEKMEKISDTFWGVTYNDKRKEQAYEPVFYIQVNLAALDEKGEVKKDSANEIVYTGWNTIDPDLAYTHELIAGEKAKYRIVFSGKKSSNTNGYGSDAIDINNSGTNTQDLNFKVDVSKEVIEEHALAFTVSSAKLAVIDTTDYNNDEKKKVYDAKPIAGYVERNDYKKASVKFDGKDISDGSLTYTWYLAQKKVSKDEAGNETVEYEKLSVEYENAYTDDIDKSHSPIAPSEALISYGDSELDGVYALEISYYDPSGQYKAKPVDIYYEIEQQKVQAEITSPETTAIENAAIKDNKYELLVDKNGTRSVDSVLKAEIGKVVKPILKNEMDDTLRGKELGEALDWIYSDYNPNQYGGNVYYGLETYYERKNKLTGEWEDAASVLEPDQEYRVFATVNIYNTNSIARNYTNTVLDKENNPVTILCKDPIYITTREMGTIPTRIVVDESKITQKTKKYDGVALEIPADAVTLVNDNDDTVINDEKNKISFRWYEVNTGYGYGYRSNAVNAGKYELYAEFIGDEKYAPTGRITVCNEYEITQREITVKATVNDPVVAGTESDYYDVINQDLTVRYEFGGEILESDKNAFVYTTTFFEEEDYSYTGYLATLWNRDNGSVKNLDGSYVKDNVLRGEKTYQLLPDVQLCDAFKYGDMDVMLYYARNYKLTNLPTEFTVVRGNAEISNFGSMNGVSYAKAKDYVDGMKHTVVPIEGIPYVQKNSSLVSDEDGAKLAGNWFVVNIEAPKEYYPRGDRDNRLYDTSFVFEDSVKNAGGYVLNDYKSSNGTITVAFNAEKKDQKTFAIRWEDGYTEEFVIDFKNAVLADNLQRAVAPKSLAFKNVAGKMAVGEKQQLDVAIKKVNNGDVNKIIYSTDATSILSVSEDGAVVALKKGKATVFATPSYEDENGEIKPIANAKVAKFTITVTDLTAPKLGKPVVWDDSATIYFNPLSDGYRRETYVVEGKGLKADAIERMIADVKNGDYIGAGFAVAPVFGDSYSSVRKQSYVDVYGLTCNKEYTVYVRNVSAIRTLGDGSVVDFSKSGSVISIKTALSQNEGITVRFDDKYENQYGEYEVKLSEGKIDAITIGYFNEGVKNTFANPGDTIGYQIPLNKELTSNYYEQPNMVYGVFSKRYRNYTHEEIMRMPKSSLAKIDKKGKLKLLGAGSVWVYAYDTKTGHSDWCELHITATPDKMTVAKSAKLKVGGYLWLGDYVTYYEGKKKLPYYSQSNYCDLDVTVDGGDEEAFEIVGSHYVIAKKPNASITLKVEDRDVKKQNENACGGTITIKSSSIDPVSNVKVSTVVDRYATLSFEYPYMVGKEFYAKTDTTDPLQLYFRVKLTDNSKRVVFDKYYNYSDLYDSDNGKKDFFALTLHDGLYRLSNYNVSVTACYLDQQSKAVTKKFKTTNIPAANPAEYGGSFYNPNGSDYDKDRYKNADGGLNIYYGLNSYKSVDNYIATSNNTYTLYADPQNIEALTRQSDTLTWKSTNPKVATVKANAGSYTATLRTISRGTTRLELVSKVTKRIVARRTIYVNALGKGDYGFYDELEPGDNTPDLDNLIDDSIDVVSMNQPLTVEVDFGKRKYVKFTAPEYGKYQFAVDNGYGTVYQKNKDGNYERCADINADISLYKGEVVYICATNASTSSCYLTYRVNGTFYQELTMNGTKIDSTTGTSFVFIAPQDNVYTFIKDDGKKKEIFQEESMSQGDEVEVTAPAGKYSLVVKKRNPVTITTEGLADQKFEKKPATREYGENFVFYEFTAPNDGSYKVVVENKDKAKSANVSVYSYSDIKSISGTDIKTVEKYLNAGDKLFFEVTNLDTAELTATVSVKPQFVVGTPIDPTQPTKTENIAVTQGEAQYVTYTIPKTGKYKFTATGKEAAAEAQVNLAANGAAGDAVDITVRVFTSTGSIIYPDADGYYELSKDDKIKIQLTVASVQKAIVELKAEVVNTRDIVVGDNEVAGSKTAAFFQFVAPENGAYEFIAKVKERADKKETLITEYKLMKGDTTFSTNSAYTIKELKKGDEVTVKVSTTYDDDKAVITINKVGSFTTANDTTSGIFDIKKGESKILKLVIPKSGYYEFSDKTDVAKEFEGKTATVTYGDTDEYISYPVPSIGNMSGTYNAGSVFYFKVTAPECDIKYTITAKQAVPVAIPAEEFTVAKNSSMWFTFTAPENNEYKWEVTGENTDGLTLNLYGSTFGFINSGLQSNVVITAGQTRYFKLTNASDTDKKVKFSVKKCYEVKDEMTLDKSVKDSFKNGDTYSYSFTAPDNGRYEFAASFTTEKGSVYPSITLYEADGSYYSSIPNERFLYIDVDEYNNIYLKAGKKVYVRVSATVSDTDAVEITTSVKKITADDITTSDEEKPTVKEEKDTAKGLKFYKITGAFEGDFVLTDVEGKTDVTDGNVTACVIGIKDNNKYYSGNIRNNVTVEENNARYLVVKTSADKMSYKLTLNRKNSVLITDPNKAYDVKLSKDNYRMVKFTAPESGWYEMLLSNVTADKTVNFSVSGGHLVNAGKEYAMSYVTRGENINMTLSTESDGDVAAQVTVKSVKASDIKDISTDGKLELKKDDSKANQVKFFSYTLPKSGKYTVKSTADAGVSVKYFGEGEYSYYEIGTGFCEMFFDKTSDGKQITLAVYYTSTPEKDFSLEIKKAEATEVEIGKELEIDVKKVLPNEKVYGTFVVPEDGRYVFSTKTEDDCGYNVSLISYRSVDVQGYWNYIQPNKEYVYSKGDVVTFGTYYYSNTSEKKYSVKVDKVAVTTLKSDGQYDLEPGNNWFSYTMNKNGVDCNYELTTDKSTNVDFTVTSDYLDPDVKADLSFDAGSYQGKIKGNLIKGQTYYFCVNVSEACKLTVKLTEDKNEYAELKTGENNLTFAKDESEKVVTFTASKTGYYKVKYENCAIYSWNSDTTKKFIKGTYFIDVYPKGGAGEETTAKVTITPMSTLDTVKFSEPMTLKFDEEGYARFAVSYDKIGLYQYTFDTAVNMESIHGVNDSDIETTGSMSTETTGYVDIYSKGNTADKCIRLKKTDNYNTEVKVTVTYLGKLYADDNQSHSMKKGDVKYFSYSSSYHTSSIYWAKITVDGSVRVSFVAYDNAEESYINYIDGDGTTENTVYTGYLSGGSCPSGYFRVEAMGDSVVKVSDVY